MQSNVSTFTDNVVIKQGTIDIRADKVVVTRPGGDQNKTYIEAFGNPVTFYQMQDSGKPVKGHAQKVRYDVATQLVTLTGNAYLEQLDSNVKGDRITYLVQQQQMQAFSDKGKRVTTVLVPSQLQDKNGQKKTYKGRKVVEDVSLKVKSGEIVGLLGPNGAGKTTTFYMVVGIVPRDAGRIVIDEEDISLLPLHARARRGIGYLPQEASIFRRLSVYDNLMAVLEIRPDLTSEQREDRAKELMEEFHISHLRDSLGQALSGGERRRVEIARALAANPKFILLDEPFAGVDPISVIDIKKIIEHLRDSGLGVLITDHNVRETLDVCERAYIVSQGKLIAHGTPDAILADEQVKRVYLGEEFRL
ncbi:hypothetical protein KR044_005853 [Drosophila immigrans]|nr:hypothetical protein KR044_005853 [Drosophila immigrans]